MDTGYMYSPREGPPLGANKRLMGFRQMRELVDKSMARTGVEVTEEQEAKLSSDSIHGQAHPITTTTGMTLLISWGGTNP
jgi:hypothetical protein